MNKLLPFALLVCAFLCGCGDGTTVDAAAESKPKETPETLAAAARDAIVRGHGQTALDAAEKALALLPDSAEYTLLLGEAAYAAGDVQKALDAFESVIAEKSLPKTLLSQAYSNKAVLELETGEMRTAALLDFARAVRLDYDNARAWYHFARCSYAANFPQAAEKQFLLAKTCPGLDKNHLERINATLLPAVSAAAKATIVDIPEAKRQAADNHYKAYKNAMSIASQRAPVVRGKTSAQAKSDARAQAKKSITAAYNANPSNGYIAHDYAKMLAANNGGSQAFEAYKHACAAKQLPSVYIEAAKYALKVQPNGMEACSILARGFASTYGMNRELVELYAQALRAAGRTAEAAQYAAFANEMK